MSSLLIPINKITKKKNKIHSNDARSSEHNKTLEK